MKKTFLIGNIIVSAFSSAALGIILFIANKGLDELKLISFDDYYFILSIFYSYILFSFIVSLAREISKDAEDLIGDKVLHSKTIPIILGLKVTRQIVAVLMILTLSVLIPISLIEFFNYRFLHGFFVLLVLAMPVVFIIFKILNAENSYDFGKISLYIKVLMFLSILILLFYVFSR